ncbi:MAG: GNAT family N-acetyltransferase [Christensenella sp.]|nr:GNAT family N-acetyltransferase [Christensenella sp.]
MKRYRISDQNLIKTKRLLLTPLSANELAQEESRESDDLLRGAIVEMRKNVLEHAEDALWYTGWRVSLKKEGTVVGLLGFHGVPVNKTIELGFNIYPDYRGQGFGQEAIRALCDWAFGSTEGYFVSVLADEKNEALNHVLEKLKFYRVESPVEGVFAWELERPASAWISFYLSIGLCLGLALGSSFFDSQLTGLTIGLAAGIALGAAMDAQDRAARKRENPPAKIDLVKEKPQE